MIHRVFPSPVETACWMDKTFISEKPWGFGLSLLHTGWPPCYWELTVWGRTPEDREEGHGQKDRRATQAASASNQGSFPGRMLSVVWRALAKKMIEENVSEMSGQEQSWKIEKTDKPSWRQCRDRWSFQHRDWLEPRSGGGTAHWKAFVYTMVPADFRKDLNQELQSH